MVGATGFEPATSCSRSRRATGLRYAPPTPRSACLVSRLNAPRRTRTSNLLIRSQMLYPIELWALEHTGCRGRQSAVHRNRTNTISSTDRKAISARKSSQPESFDLLTHHTPRPLNKNPCGSPQGMGGTRLELVTSTMSTWRSNQLS